MELVVMVVTCNTKAIRKCSTESAHICSLTGSCSVSNYKVWKLMKTQTKPLDLYLLWISKHARSMIDFKHL